MKEYSKQQGSTLDYGFLWYDWLEGKTITASVWTSSSPDLVILDSSFTERTTAVFVSGGIVNSRYTLTNTITTSGTTPLVDTRTLSILIIPTP